MARICIVDDEASMREFLEIFLRKQGHDTVQASGGAEALEILEREEFDLVLTDLKMPRVGGIDVLVKVKSISPDTEVILMTAYSTAETAIAAMKKGAHDYIEKPFKVDEIGVVIEKCLEKRMLHLENVRLRSELRQRYSFGNIIGRSEPMRKVFDLITRVARTRTSVLIAGESGTGKELVAKAIHYNSPRQNKQFQVINCGAIPDTLMESELFGHVKGAFTGAIANKKGLFEVADCGTVFLDEIAELSTSMQVKLLRVLQERTFKPVGGVAEIPVDVRVIAASNKVLEDEVRDARFREDLYYRINVITIQLPPLRERREDIPLLAQHFVNKYADEMDQKILGIDPDVMEALVSYHYPGNVRELENIIERAITFQSGDTLDLQSLPTNVTERSNPGSFLSSDIFLPETGLDLEVLLADLEKTLLYKALAKTNGVKTEAARLLGISFRSIRYKLDKFGIDEQEIEALRG